MALWRVLDKTSAPLRGASSTRHKPTQRNKQNRETAEKAKRRRKSGGAVNPLRTPRFFYAAAFFAFSLRRFSFRRCYSHRLFCVPFTFRYLAATLCATLLLCNPFVTRNYLSMPPQNFLLCGIIVYA